MPENVSFTIPYRLPSLNDVIADNRANRYMGAKLKKDTENGIIYIIKAQRVKAPEKYPVTVDIEWHEENRKRDADNIQSSQKFILDAMVKAGVLQNDSRKYVSQVRHNIVDDSESKVIVKITEVAHDTI